MVSAQQTTQMSQPIQVVMDSLDALFEAVAILLAWEHADLGFKRLLYLSAQVPSSSSALPLPLAVLAATDNPGGRPLPFYLVSWNSCQDSPHAHLPELIGLET